MRPILGKLTSELYKHTNPKDVGKDDGFFINTYRDLVEQVAKLAYLNKDHLLFFRGQKSDYKNKADKSTFYPTIYRGDHVTQEELDYRFDKLNSASKILVELFSKHKIEGVTELKRKKLIQWSILQHYEVTETPLIDITQSLRVACSFAQLFNDHTTAYIYVFGLPYYSNRISTNSEQDLVNIRLLSITPPKALRPYFQEGFLIGTDDITNEYENKSELDLNNRLIAKFKIPNSDDFWGEHFDRIPKDALYPQNDIIEEICKEIENQIQIELAPLNIGNFLKLWATLENTLIKRSRNYIRETHRLRDALYVLMKYEDHLAYLYREIDTIRMFRNKVVHRPMSVENEELKNQINSLNQINIEMQKFPS
ncbi:FRG domain-containing protein [Algoriphagus locisalis]|uniref:FRG domain-containing protein n=1 Tax=Algoriphagus locisalis TaxID=305507 RepID=A0A1I6YLD3_9BACT|nr:FRG domain-containing protein [Algoriphagus locisalis]SFT51061.1 FRG domain-containing protein [Algoriphagus locisalis]